MKLKIRKIIDSVSFLNIINSGFNYPKLLLKQAISFVTLYVQISGLPEIILDLRPVITNISPLVGYIAGGEIITITGINLGTVYKVSFSGYKEPATFFWLGDDGMTVIVPPSDRARTCKISISNSYGNYIFGPSYTYIVAPGNNIGVAV